MAKVVRLFGKADSFDIEFSRKAEKWTVDIPPDLVDGVYAVQLTAIDELGEVAYWVGELYMCNGSCCIKITKKLLKNLKLEKYGFEYAIQSTLKFNNTKNYKCVFKNNSSITLHAKKMKCDVVFKVPNCVKMSEQIRADISTKRLQIKDSEKKMLIRCKSALSIGKEHSCV